MILIGDQLTLKHARGSKKIQSNSKYMDDKLEGLLPVAEDWHTKVVQLEVINTSTLCLCHIIKFFIRITLQMQKQERCIKVQVM